MSSVEQLRQMLLSQSVYICANCQHTFTSSKERKRCPECKKHQLVKQNLDVDLMDNLEEPEPKPKNLTDQFTTQIRQRSNSRVRYTETGKEEGVYTRSEPIEGVTNVWDDVDPEEGQDRDNEILKKFTKVSERTRKPVNMVEVKCDSCNRVERVHPIHVSGRSRHLCNKCVARRSKI